MKKGMRTRIYPTSRKLLGLCGDVAIITLTYIFLTYLIIPSGIQEMHHTLFWYASCYSCYNYCNILVSMVFIPLNTGILVRS